MKKYITASCRIEAVLLVLEELAPEIDVWFCRLRKPMPIAKPIQNMREVCWPRHRFIIA